MSAEQEAAKVVVNDPGLLWKALGLLWGVIVTAGSALVGIIWRKHNEEIAGIKSSIASGVASVSQKFGELDNRVDHLERTLPEKYTPIARFIDTEDRMREGLIAVHQKIETSNAQLTSKIDAANAEAARRHNDLMQLLLQQRK